MALINLNDTTPAAPAGFANSKWQADAPGADRNVSSYQPNIGGVNAQTGTTYTLQASDNGKLITFSNSSAVAFALPDASSFDVQFTFAVTNLGAGAVTLTPATSPSTCHIDGAASLVITTGQGADIYSDGANYFTERGRADIPASVGLLLYGNNNPNGGNFTPTMTSNSAPSPNVTLASSENVYPAWGAFANHTTGNFGWQSTGNTGWIQLFTSVTHVLTSYSLQEFGFGAWGVARMAKDWTLKGSNDGSTWTTLDTQTNQTGWGTYEIRTYSVANSTAYSYYRIEISANNGDSLLEVLNIVYYAGSTSGTAGNFFLDLVNLVLYGPYGVSWPRIGSLNP